MRCVVAPVVDDVQNFRAHDSAEYDQNAEVPSFVAVNAQPLGISHANPQADQDAERYQKSIGGQEETSEMD